MYYIFTIVLFFICSIKASFSDLDGAKKFASKLKEHPQILNNNYLSPKYYKDGQSLFAPLWEKLSFFKGKSFELEFAELLHQMVEKPYEKIGAISIESEKQDRFFIWGDLQGSFHSLVRCLRNLNSRGVIDSNLKIQSDKDYLIFNGNLVGKSAYDIEILYLVFLLIIKNPKQVFYIKGNQEDSKLWQGHSLGNAIDYRFSSYDKSKIEVDLGKFFGGLPTAVYLDSKLKGTLHQVRISYFNGNELELESQKGSILEAVVKGVNRSVEYTTTDGLQKTHSEQGAVGWNVLSAPVKSFDKIYKFHNDAYVELLTGEKVSDWIITLYKQDAKSKSGFVSKKYNFLLGSNVKDSNKYSNIDKVYSFVSTIDLSKSSIALGKRLQSGFSLCFDKQNSLGGVRGYRVRQVLYDDGYTPSLTFKYVNQFLKHFDSNVALTPLGTPTTKVLLPMAEKKELLVLFPYTGAQIFRKPGLVNFVHYRTSYGNEAKALIKYALDVMHKKKFAFFYQDDSYGLAPLTVSRDMLKKVGINKWVEAPYTANTINVDLALSKVKEFNPDVILFYSTVPPSVELVRKLGVEYLSSKALMGISFLTDSFRYVLENKGLKFVISRVVPNYNDHKIKIAKDYHQISSEKGSFKSADALEAYINGQLFISAIKNAKSLSPDAIVKYFEGLQHVDFQGLKLNFDPQTRELSQNVWVDSGSDKWTYYDINKI